MKNHECLVGKHQYRPGHGFYLKRKPRGFTLGAVITESAWFDPTNAGPLDKGDGKDQNKLAGVTFVRLFSPAAWLNNRNTVLVTWRPSERPGYFEVTGYTNDRRGGFVWGSFITVKADTYFYCDVTIDPKGKATFEFKVDGKDYTVSLGGFDGRGRGIPIGPYFGGNRRSPVKHVIATEFTII